ncbi:hypothetical protein L596_019393 [Steinernema carpocapsae]|uniref:Telomerase reverse transcriptase n=1 Tax=Steinernema carpocapsae TaxID=34508 RepID=A0A4U5MQE4_STECR|nr:hypothetical protein L596_019393 [Steinernema carpocapsae]
MAARKRPKRARKPPPIDASLLYPTNPRRAFSWTPSAVLLVRDRFCFAPLFDREFRRFVPKKKIGVEKLVAAISSEQLNSCPWLKDLLRQDIEEIERRWRKTRVRRIFNDCMPQMKLGSYEALIRQSVSFQQLRAFISRCFHFLVPVTFIGSSNSAVLVEDFVQIIFSLNTREEIDLRRTFQKMKIGEIRWIKKTRCQPLQVVLLQDLVRFLLHLVLGCIVSVMKFVEVNKVRGSTVLYRYDVWRQLERKGLEEFMNVQQCKSVSMNERNAEVSSEMRFQVRTACLRPIVRISSEPHIALKRQANAILRYLIDKNQSPTFHSGSLTLFPRLLVNFRNSLPTNASQKIYMFTGDISNCFPCVNISHLKEILANLIGDTPRFFVCSDSLFGGRYAAGLTQREACENLKNRAKNFDYGNLTYKQITTEQFLKILDMGRLVRYRDRYLRPHRGIGQGDHMSASLCSLYLASLEKSVEGFLDPAKTFSFRYADDYLLLSTDFEEIQSIILGLLYLFTINGLQMKEEKMSMNFDLFGSGETTSLRVVTWCGFTVSDRLDLKSRLYR